MSFELVLSTIALVLNEKCFCSMFLELYKFRFEIQLKAILELIFYLNLYDRNYIFKLSVRFQIELYTKTNSKYCNINLIHKFS